MCPILCLDAFIALLNLMQAVDHGRTPESPRRQTSTTTEAMVESSRVQIVSQLQDQAARELMNREKEGSLRCQSGSPPTCRDSTWGHKTPKRSRLGASVHCRLGLPVAPVTADHLGITPLGTCSSLFGCLGSLDFFLSWPNSSHSSTMAHGDSAFILPLF